MDNIVRILFDLKRSLQFKREAYFDFFSQYTNEESCEGFAASSRALKRVDALLDEINNANEFDLKCEQRQTRGSLEMCDYCDAYANEMCRWQS